MSTKRIIIILGGGFGGVKCAEALLDELPPGYQELDEVAAPIRLASRRHRANALGNHRAETKRRWAS
jgi:NADH dehydrogenase FAD-containing subunit